MTNSSFHGSPRKRNFSQKKRRQPVQFDERQFIAEAKTTLPKEQFVPQISFDKLHINATLKRNIIEKGFTEPTPIQDQAIPAALDGNDVLGIANTGTGKTAAFLIPLIQKVIQNRETRVLIVTPTRELAEQIADELYLLSLELPIGAALCIGGSNMYSQIQAIKRNPHFIIGTPGRLKDLYDRNILRLNHVDSLVLDEVDRMLDMGFINDITYLTSKLKKERQSLFFSATLDPKIEKIIKETLKPDHINISVRTRETAENVTQKVLHYSGKLDKEHKLLALLKTPELQKVLLFMNMKWHVEKMEKLLRTQGFKVEALHGDKRQNQRTRALDAFKAGKANILIATDVAARGLDVKGITHVINFDVPNNYEDYIHRIGRTGRAQEAGTAITFVEKSFSGQERLPSESAKPFEARRPRRGFSSKPRREFTPRAK